MSAQERTQQATQRRRAQAVREGYRADSTVLHAALVLCGAAIPCAVAMRQATHWPAMLHLAVDRAAGVATVDRLDSQYFAVLSRAVMHGGLPVVAASWLATAVAAMLSCALAGGLALSPAALTPRLSRISWSTGVRRMASAERLRQSLAAALCVAVSCWCAVPAIALVLVASGARLGPVAQVAVAGHAAFALWWRASLTLCALGAVDAALARRRLAARLRMTLREVRDERSEHEGKPEIKARRRALAQRRARGMRLSAIKRATVVVTNPTHVAVALRYAPPAVDVPVVVARAKDLATLLLRAAADSSGVPIVESPELARTLYWSVDVDQAIPEECYAAVAAIFAWLLRTRGALGGVEPR